MMTAKKEDNISIKVIQINLGHRANAHDVLMKWLISRDEQWIVCVQEPYFTKKGVSKLPPNYGAFWHDEGTKPRRAMIIAPKAYKGYLITQHSSPDRIIVRFDKFNISIVSIYCPIDKDINETLQGLWKEGEVQNKIIGCLDSNAHNVRWGSILKKRRWKRLTRGTEIADMFDENGFYICNAVPHPPTFIRDSSVHDASHIDVTVCTFSLYNRIQQWKVRDEPFMSDHCAISFQVNLNVMQEKVEQLVVEIPWRKPRGRMKYVMREALCSCPKKLMWVNKVEEVEDVIIQHSEQVRKVLNGVFKKKQGSKAKESKVYWWNEEVKVAYMELRMARRRMRRYKYDDLKEIFNSKRREFRRVIRRVKVEAWRKFTTEVSDPWDKLIKIIKANMSGKIQTRTLSDLKGEFAGNMSETLKLLGKQFFPPADRHLEVHIVLQKEVEAALCEVERGPRFTICEFRKAIREMSKATAPGLDLITNNVIQILAIDAKLEFKYLKIFNMCLENSYFPTIWKKAKIVLIPKTSPLPNSAKSFRSISLTSSFAKLLERMVLARLLHYLSLSGKMTENQHAYRKGASTQTALFEVFNVVQTAMTKRRGGLCVVVFLDISGAFDCTWHDGILHKLLMYGVPKYLVAWIRSFLSGRTAYFNEGNKEHEVNLEQGCPQGGVLSPILWNVLFNEMLAIPVEKGKGKLDCMKVVGYADDAAIVCKVNTIEEAEGLLNKHLEKISQWACLNKVKFNPAKLAVISISNKITRPQPIALYYNNSLVHEVNSYKYLGLIVDNKLKWSLHVTYVLNKLSLVTQSLRGLSRGSWGINLDIYRLLFHSIFMPVMTYGIGIWGWKAASKTVCDKFDKEIRKFALMATRCMKSTSNMYVLNLLRTQSFSHIMHFEVLKTSVEQFHIVRSNRQQVYETYRRNIISREVPQCMDQLFFMLRRGIEKKIYDVEFDNVNEHFKVHPSQWVSTNCVVHDSVTAMCMGSDKRGWVMYTDASASSYGIGWGIVAFHNGFCVHKDYGALTKCSVFVAEAYALLQAVRFVNNIERLGNKEQVEIRSDAQGLVRSLSRVEHMNTLMIRIKEELRKASREVMNVLVLCGMYAISLRGLMYCIA